MLRLALLVVVLALNTACSDHTRRDIAYVLNGTADRLQAPRVMCDRQVDNRSAQTRCYGP